MKCDCYHDHSHKRMVAMQKMVSKSHLKANMLKIFVTTNPLVG